VNPECDALTHRETLLIELWFRPRCFLAGIDVRIYVEDEVIGIVEHGSLERSEGARIIRALAERIGSDTRAGMPNVKLQRADLSEPKQRRQVVHENVIVSFVFVLREHRHGLDELRQSLLPVLLEEALTVYAVRHADHGQGSVRQMRQHPRRHASEITNVIAFRDLPEPTIRIGRPVHTIKIRELDARIANYKVDLLPR